jgi:hypothetical protein
MANKWDESVEAGQAAVEARNAGPSYSDFSSMTPGGPGMGAGPSVIGQWLFGKTQGAEAAGLEAKSKRLEADASEEDERVRRQRGVYTEQERREVESAPNIVGSSPNATTPLSAAPGDPQLASETVEGVQYPEGIAEQRMRLADALMQAEKEMAGRRGQAATIAINTAKQAAAQRHAAEAIGRGGEKYAREYMRNLSAAYDEAELNIASLRVDPQRWEEDTPALAQVLMAIASSAFSFFSGGQGPNPVVALIDRAIERDMQAQMANIQNKLKASQLGIEKEQVLGELGTAMHSAMYERALNTVESIIKEGGLAEDAELQAATMQGLMANAIKARISAYDASAQKYSRVYKAASAEGQGTQLKPNVIVDYGKRVAVVIEGLDLLDKVKETGSNKISQTRVYSLLTGSEEADLRADLLGYIRKLSRAEGVEVGNFSQSDAKVIENLIDSARWDQAARRIEQLFNKTGNAIESLESDYAGLRGAGYDTRAFDPHLARVKERILRQRSKDSGRAK